MWYVLIMNGTTTLTMGDRGRLVIPAGTRERFGLTTGTPVVLVETDQGLVLMTREQLLKRVRSDLQGHDLVGSLLADRRREAEREAA